MLKEKVESDELVCWTSYQCTN